MNDVIAQATQLLRNRQDEINAMMAALQDEQQRIDAALDKLNAAPAEFAALRATRNAIIHGTSGLRSGSVTSAVFRLMATRADHWWSNDELLVQLRDLQGDRTEDSFKSTIRTALFTLRNRGDVVSENGRHHIAKDLSGNSAGDASGPVDAGPEESQTTMGEGVDDAQVEEGDDHRPPGRDRDHRGGGTAVAEPPLDLVPASAGAV